MAKRKLEDVDVSDIDSPIENVTVHGVVTSLSPVKASKKMDHKKYFNANITDGKTAMRLISFEPSLRPEMDISCAQQKTIAVVNCQVKETPEQYQSGSSDQSKYEILLSSRSAIQKSPKKFTVDPDIKSDGETVQTIALEDLPIISVNQKVTVCVKVINVEIQTSITTKTGKQLNKQDCIVADTGGTCRVVLWESDIGKLAIDKSYRLENMTVRAYKDSKYLSLSDASVIIDIDNIGEIASQPDDLRTQNENKIIEGEIIAVVYAEEYIGCFTCNAKVKQINEVIGECTKCGLKLKLKRCKNAATARVKFEDRNGYKMDVTLFGKEIESITAEISGKDLVTKLLNTPDIRLCVNSANIATSASLV